MYGQARALDRSGLGALVEYERTSLHRLDGVSCLRKGHNARARDLRSIEASMFGVGKE